MSTTNDKPTFWVGFDENAATLRRLIAPHDIRGLILTLADTSEGEKVREKAKEYGFVELGARRHMRKFFVRELDENGKEKKLGLRISDIAAALNGNLITVPYNELVGDKWTVNLSDRAPSLLPKGGQQAEKAEIIPVPSEIEHIGLNIRGEEVVRDKAGRFFRRTNTQTGSSQFVHESADEKATLFLRATKPEDLEAIASALVVMAGKATLYQSDFSRVINAALEAGPHGKLELSKRQAEDIISSHMMREITSIAIDNDSSREKFIQALRISAAAGFVLSRDSEAGSQLSPSPALAAFLRRQSAGQVAVDFRGRDIVKVAMPRVHREGASFQFSDLGGVSDEGLNAFTSNVLARRDAEGRSILRVPAQADTEVLNRLRSEIGINYALEGVAEIAPAVADGVQDGNYSTLFFVGERRPEPLDALPIAAMRTFSVQTNEDLINLERDIQRARAKIRDFHKGVESELSDKADDREENVRQRPYQPLSRAKEPFTMIPVALEGATRKALDRVTRDMEERGGSDAVVAASLGVSMDGLGDILTAEQVDAVAMRLNALERGRGILIADQTGVGKGRTLAAIALAHLRSGPEKKVLYFTESGAINAPDVYRDLRDIGATKFVTPTFLTSGSVVDDTRIDEGTGLPVPVQISSLSKSRRKAIIDSASWPAESRLVITTYTQFRGGETDPAGIWFEHALDNDTLIILDEAHNALNEKSMQGQAIRKAMDSVKGEDDWSNVVYGTATPMREPSGMNLFAPLMPPSMTPEAIKGILNNVKSGGEVAQETLATVFAADGVMRRLDHDLSNIDFQVALPDDGRMIAYQNIMNQISPIVEMMIEASSQVGTHMGRRQALEFARLRAEGLSEQAARAQSNELNQYSTALGSPLANFARLAMNAIKVDQVVDEVLQELQEGRKPLITFHSTYTGLLDDFSRDADGAVSPQAMDNANNLTLKDQIHRIHERMYRLTIDEVRVDAREMYPNVRETSESIKNLINALPDGLPASPVDSLIEKLEMHGVSVGEISGRTLAYRNNRIVRRTPAERNKKRIIDASNKGEIDCLIYNAAGATGGSFHASEKFRDQRPRTMIELEAPTDIIKYVQAQGRGNRYGQIHNPRIKSVMTGLTPEMRILQQRNKKLRSLGASVDGNRSHPMLLDDIPDLLNKVGDEATRNVLSSLPSLARRMGFPELADEVDVTLAATAGDEGSGASAKEVESLANKVLARSIMLTAAEQDDLVQRIRMEFDTLIEELESRNANPLRPKELEGQIEVKGTTIYSGKEIVDGDLDASGFSSPLYISTAIHHFNEEAWNGEKLVNAIEGARRLYGAEGFAPYASRLRQNLPALMRHYVPEDVALEDALGTPALAGARFATRLQRFRDLASLLENLKPGMSMNFPRPDDKFGLTTFTVVGLVPPANPDHYDLANAYKVRIIAPGYSKPETISISRFVHLPEGSIVFRPGLSEEIDDRYLDEFNRESVLTRRLPVQILHGNLLQALTESSKNDLGTVSLYRDMEGVVHRGIVVPRSKINLDLLPVSVAGASVSATLAKLYLSDANLRNAQGALRLWGDADPSKAVPQEKQDAEIYISLTLQSVSMDFPPLRRSTEDYYRERPGLYEALHQKPLPPSKDIPARAVRRGANSNHNVRFKLDCAAAIDRFHSIMERLGECSFLADSPFRAAVNEIHNGDHKHLAPRELSEVMEDVTDNTVKIETAIVDTAPELDNELADVSATVWS